MTAMYTPPHDRGKSALDVVVNENAVATMFAGSMVGELGLYEAKERSMIAKVQKWNYRRLKV